MEIIHSNMACLSSGSTFQILMTYFYCNKQLNQNLALSYFGLDSPACCCHIIIIVVIIIIIMYHWMRIENTTTKKVKEMYKTLAVAENTAI